MNGHSDQAIRATMPTDEEFQAWLDELTPDELEEEFTAVMGRDYERHSECALERQAGNWYELPVMPERDAAIAAAYWAAAAQ